MKRKRKEKLSELATTRLEPSVVERLRAVAEHLCWSEAQVHRWCIQHSLPVIERIRLDTRP